MQLEQTLLRTDIPTDVRSFIFDLLAQREGLLDQFIQILNTTSVGLVLFDESLQIRFANQFIVEQLHYTSEELQQRNFFTLFPEQDHPILQQAIDRCHFDPHAKDKQAIEYDIDCITQQQTCSPYQIKIEQLLLESGLRYLATFVDISTRKQQEKELLEKNIVLEQLNSQLQQANIELERFAYMASHDLKAPLRGINNLINWITEETINSDNKKIYEYYQLIKQRAQRMHQLIDGILQYARLSNTNAETYLVDTRELLLEISENLDIPNTIMLHLPEKLPIIDTARVPLSQIFSNLINNSIKYHNKDNGHIVIKFSDAQNFITFYVIDDGPGIAPEFHEKIFLLFQTLQSRDTIESTGIGLTIVKKLVESYGGSINIKSDLGQGCEISFTWPKLIPHTSPGAIATCETTV